MKKVISLLPVFVMLLSLAACGSNTQSAESSSAAENVTSVEDTEEVQDNETEEADASAEDTEETETTSDSSSNALVVYFSLAGEQYSVGTIDEGNTAIIAKMIAEETGAEMKEGLAVAGTTAQNDRDAALSAVQSWLEEVHPFC